MTRDLKELIAQLEAGIPLEVPPELRELAEQAAITQAKIQEQVARGEFDIEAWARRLAEDVADLTD